MAVDGKPEAYRTVRRQSRTISYSPVGGGSLLSADRILAERNGLAARSTDSGRFAFAFANTAAQLASMGRGDFVSWAAFGSDARDRADGIWRDLVCD